ncbi:MAG: isopenicillin N synthase family oxygenase [Deltaproteobacteria bacterium]|nr:isopenicillin N synthase family oxygenase [Deltaproteobacteria bacterium]
MSERKSKQEGVAATNRDYIDYDQVEKRQSYHFTEDARAEEFDEDFEVKTCDLGRFLNGDEQDRRAFARELGAALEEIGFAILTGHGVDPEIHAACEREVERVFTAHTLAEKLRFAAERHGSVNQGYFPIEETTDIHPDLVEGWVFCRRAFDLGDAPVHVADYWPEAASEAVFRRLVQAQEPLIRPLMQSILMHLGCDPHHYDARLTDTNFAVRLNYYPPVVAGSRAGRLLGHEDIDLFTLLPAPRVEGLQALNRRNMKWVRLDAPPGSIILNTGDYTQRISNDRLPSTTHRVSQPREPADRGRARVSFPMNVYVWENELLEVLPGLENPRYEPIRAVEFHTRTTAKYYGDDYAVRPTR